MSSQISGFLIDIDGVLITGDQTIPGSIEALRFLKQKHIPFLLATNTTRKSRATIWNNLRKIGFSVEEEQILTAPLAAVNWLKNKRTERINLLLSGSAVNDFNDFNLTTTNPEYVVVGDLGEDLSFDKLNTAFRAIMQGAKILALQKNRYWQTNGGLTIDAGAIVSALQFATRKRALIIGKPRKQFFLQAAQLLKLPPSKVAIVGDDLESDIQGGQKAELLGIAVKTGKFRTQFLRRTKIKPDVILNSIKDLPLFIKKEKGYVE